MRKLILILLLMSFSYVSALTEEEAEEVLILHEANIKSVDKYIASNKHVIKEFLSEWWRCNDRDRSYQKALRNFFDYGKNIAFADELAYEIDEKYIELKAKSDLLNEKKDLLKSGITLTQEKQLSDGTKFTEILTGYNWLYDEELEELEILSGEIINAYKLRHIKERQKYNELQEHLSRELLQTCIQVLDNFRAEKEVLYEKLDQIDSDKPWVLDTLLPQLKEIKDHEKYKKYKALINVIINYIENK